MTAALKGGEWSTARPGRTLPPRKTRYPLYRRLGGPQDRSGRAENLVPTGTRSRTVQLVVSRYTDWTTGPAIWLVYLNILPVQYIIKVFYISSIFGVDVKYIKSYEMVKILYLLYRCVFVCVYKYLEFCFIHYGSCPCSLFMRKESIWKM